MSLEFQLRLPLRDFDLDLAGNFTTGTTGIFGPSGAGKTTFFSLIAGLVKPETGTIKLHEKTLTDTEKNVFIPPNKRRIGIVFQEKLLFPHMSVRENLLFGQRYNPEGESKTSLTEVTTLLELSSLLNSMPHEISGGEQQRVAIGRALLTGPEILLLDEPFNAVDNSLRATILPFLKRLQQDLNIPMLVISHDLPDIQRLTDKIYIIENGKCGGYGNTIALYDTAESLNEKTGMVNIFHLHSPVKQGEEIYSYSVEGVPGFSIIVPGPYRETMTQTLKPGAIALAKSRVIGTSIQNQLPGKIVRLISQENHVLCVVDAGIQVVAKITELALRELDLSKGDRVYCLFKAHSITK